MLDKNERISKTKYFVYFYLGNGDSNGDSSDHNDVIGDKVSDGVVTTLQIVTNYVKLSGKHNEKTGLEKNPRENYCNLIPQNSLCSSVFMKKDF